MSTFDSTKTPLPDIIRDIREGRIQLPDFQRGWVWDDDHVRSLLVSVARSFPVGAVMLLDTGGEVRFQVRPVENLPFDGLPPKPERLILDGQQRLTSLTQVLALDSPVRTFNEKGKEIDRYYYIDIEAALDDRLDEAFIAVESDRKLKTNFGRDVVLDLSDREKECKSLHFPCNQILNPNEWEYSLLDVAPELFKSHYIPFRMKVLTAFSSYQLPVIALGKSTSKEAVCLVFEKVNTGGVPLSVFELVTASFAADGFNLRDDWYGSKLRKIEGRVSRLSKESLLDGVEPTDFLQAISLLQTRAKRQEDLAIGKIGKQLSAISAKRVSVLGLSLNDYEYWAPIVEKGFLQAASFLKKQCFYTTRDLPYRTQLVPLAAVLSQLGEHWREPKVFDKVSRWYWCGVFGELYGGAVETRIANDLDDLLRWIDGDIEEPRTVYEAAFQSGRLVTLRSRQSAAYKGLSVLLLREGAKDFFWKDSVQRLDLEEVALDIHHIFPKAWCEQNNIAASVYNSVINKTAISYKANRMIGGKAPSDYLAQIQKHQQVELGDEAMDEILISHKIDPETLRKNDFDQFIKSRQSALLGLIESVMGKETEKDE